ncbi:PIG-L deacetylase family protein [Bacteroidota bacterium]
MRRKILLIIPFFLLILLNVNAQKYDHIIISPHIGDAVYSCGGLIAKYVNLKQKVLVITFYIQQPDVFDFSKKNENIVDYDIRLKEDSAALNFLGAEYEYLDLEEKTFISPPVKKNTNVFKSPVEGSKGYVRMDTIAYIIEELIIKYPEAKFYLPIGAGNHYDHMEIFLAGIQLIYISNFHYQIYFYEDAYVLLGNRIKKKHYVLNQKLYSKRYSPEKTSMKLRSMSRSIGSAINTTTIRNDYNSLMLNFSWKLNKDLIPLLSIDKKIEAMAKYESQVEEFGGINRLRRAVYNHYRFWENYEPLWQIKK